MIDPTNVPDVAPQELLARYILFRKHVRSNQTLRPDAFMPHPSKELSVTRHLMATEAELWAVGRTVAHDRGRTLYGRGDIRTTTCIQQDLAVDPAPLPNNPNHANIVGWLTDKPAQKSIAQEIAAESTFIPADSGSGHN